MLVKWNWMILFILILFGTTWATTVDTTAISEPAFAQTAHEGTVVTVELGFDGPSLNAVNIAKTEGDKNRCV